MWTGFVLEKQVKPDKIQKEQYVLNCLLFSENNVFTKKCFVSKVYGSLCQLFSVMLLPKTTGNNSHTPN